MSFAPCEGSRGKSGTQSPFVFVSERGSPLSVAAFQKLIGRSGKAAGLGFKVHAHQLRHACGFALANRGVESRSLQAYLGHRNIQNTVRYTNLAPGRFKRIFGRTEREVQMMPLSEMVRFSHLDDNSEMAGS